MFAAYCEIEGKKKNISEISFVSQIFRSGASWIEVTSPAKHADWSKRTWSSLDKQTWLFCNDAGHDNFKSLSGYPNTKPALVVIYQDTRSFNGKNKKKVHKDGEITELRFTFGASSNVLARAALLKILQTDLLSRRGYRDYFYFFPSMLHSWSGCKMSFPKLVTISGKIFFQQKILLEQ